MHRDAAAGPLDAQLEPFVAFVQGLAQLDTLDRRQIQQARQAFEDGLRRAPAYARAHVLLSMACGLLRDDAASQVTSGIVTQATPFLVTRRRRFRRYVGGVAFLILAVPIALGALAFAAVGPPAFQLVWILGGIVVMVATDSRLSKWLIEVGRRRQTDIIAALLPPPVDPSRLLILCSRRDEARGGLRALDLVAQAPFVIAAALLPVAGLLGREPIARVFRLDTRTDVVIAAVLVSMVVLIFSGLIRWPGYGRDSLWAHLLVAIGTDRTPRERGGRPHTAYSFDVPRPPARQQRISRRLRHKAICNTPPVVAAIGDWITRGTRPEDEAA